MRYSSLDDVVPRIVSPVADTQGIMPHSMTEALRSRDPDKLSPYEAVLRSFGHFQRLNAAEHAAPRPALERAAQQSPDRGDCWAGRDELRKWWDTELIEHLIEGLRKAGLEIAGEQGTPTAKPRKAESWRCRSEETLSKEAYDLRIQLGHLASGRLT